MAEADFTTNLKFAANEVETEYFMYTNGPCYPLLFPENYLNFLNYCGSKRELLSDGIFGVEIIKGFLLYGDEFLNFKPQNMAYSQNVLNVQRVVWGLAIRENSMVLENGSLMSNPKNTYVIPNNNAIDIDYESDMLLAQAVLNAKIPESRI